MFFERRCPACGCQTRGVCAVCWGRLSPAPSFALPGVDQALALYEYDERSQPIVLAAKNGGRRDLLVILGRHLARQIQREGLAVPPIVAWVPASAERRRQRGHDQGRILARAVARELGVRHAALLARDRGPGQQGRSGDERRIGPIVRARRAVDGPVLVLDDVVTTGASMAAAAGALRRAGAVGVMAAALTVSSRTARTPATSYCGRTNTSRDSPGSQWEVPRWR